MIFTSGLIPLQKAISSPICRTEKEGRAVDLLSDGVVVEGSVGLQVRLGIGDAILLQGAFALPDADDLLQGVIGRPDGAQQLVARQEVGPQRQCQRMGAAGDLGPDQRRLRVEHVGIDTLQIVPALVIVAVAGRGGEVCRVHAVFLHRADDFCLIELSDLFDSGKAGFELV